MKTLFDILKNTNCEKLHPSLEKLKIAGITSDSRQVKPGFLFVAVKGTAVDGHDFLQQAIDAGANAILYEDVEKIVPVFRKAGCLKCENTAGALAIAAANFYENPSEKLTLIGITGTNGKTTVSTLLWQLFTKIGHKCGLIGTVENRIGTAIMPATHTTPDPVSLQKLLNEMVEAGCSHVFMEVSSHAIEQRRTAGCYFAGALFTNLTLDHLDYHKTMEAYRDAKKRLFDELAKTAFALINADDRNGKIMLQNSKADKKTFGVQKMADFKAKILENSFSGLHLQLDGVAIHCRLIGDFNASNLAAAYGIARLLGIEKMEALTAVSDLAGAEGRFECLVNQKTGTVGIVDYAHTPDALEKVLETIVSIRKQLKNSPKIITVVGCGGDRDKTKRPIMGGLAAKFSDKLILTSDNPRTEDPNEILKDMERGISPEMENKVLIISDRKQAIKTACQLAQPKDIVLIAGKGHEKYQDIRGVKHDFDDMELLKIAFQ